MTKEEMIQLFLEEALERVGDLSNSLLQLERDPNNIDLINILFRVAHTIKGNAYTAYNTVIDMDKDDATLIHMNKIAKVTHAMEDLITEARDNNLPLTQERIDVLFETENVLSTLLSYIEEMSDDDLETETLSSKIRELTKDTVSGSHTFEVTLECDESFKHAFLSLIYREVEDKFDNVSFEPSFDYLMTGEDFTNVFITIYDDYPKEEIIRFLLSNDNVKNAVPVEGHTPILETEDEVIEEESESTEIEDVKKEETPTAKEPEKKVENKKQTKNRSITNNSIRISISRIDDVLKDVSSLVILKNKLSSYSKALQEADEKALKDISEAISQTVDSLQDNVMKIRMTPLEQLFGHFPRDVRQVSKEFGKNVNFSYTGADTEIDKSLLDDLRDPLMHLIRNSIFHGLELAEERIAAGKEETGNLTLSAKQEQGKVVITIEDDGKGIDVEKITKKAIAKGIITEERAKVAPKHELINLIFAQGLSTAEVVNDVAGRGVGMDAVRAKIEEMKGNVQVFSEVGKGTRTVISLPLTLAIIKAMLTKISNEYFAFPLASVEEVVNIRTKDIQYIANQEMYLLRGEKEVPILRLNRLFHIDSPSDESKSLNLVILKIGEKILGVSVDVLIGQEDIVVKNIGKYLGNLPGISGCNILSDGSISLIVDVNSLLQKV